MFTCRIEVIRRGPSPAASSFEERTVFAVGALAAGVLAAGALASPALCAAAFVDPSEASPFGDRAAATSTWSRVAQKTTMARALREDRLGTKGPGIRQGDKEGRLRFPLAAAEP